MKAKLLNNFLRISKIYRESGHEEKIADFFVRVAKQNNLFFYKDANNNVLIRKKGSRKGASVSLQAHLDMVCVQEKGSNHDFKSQGVDVTTKGNIIRANGTSLGADQGVGLAMMLTLIEEKEANPPDLEFLFTAEEETTFKGAVTFPYDKVTSKRMINLDSAVMIPFSLVLMEIFVMNIVLKTSYNK